MSIRPTLLPVLAIAYVAATLPILTGGCGELAEFISDARTVGVEIVNDTGFPVDPNIRFDDDAGFLASLFPADTLDTGLIDADETATYTFDCDELGLIFSDEAEQVLPLFGDYITDATDILERGSDYDCGDVIRFRFVGEGLDFGVIVSVNGHVVD